MGIDYGFNSVTKLSFWRAILAELFGTTFYLLCVTTVALPWGRPNDVVEGGIGTGLAITSLIVMIDHLSGGHMNPSVTIGMMVGGRMSILQGIFYMIAQVAGGIAGTALTFSCTPTAMREINNLGATKLADGVSPVQGFVLELLFTFMLVSTILSITDPINKFEKFGKFLGIGVVIWVCHVCLIPYTGCSMNPARSFGPALLMNAWKDHWVYWVGPLVGGILAPILYNNFFYPIEENTPQETEADTGSEMKCSASI